MLMKVIADREVQLARQRAHEVGDDRLADMLQQLLDFREHGRIAVSEHDFRIYYNRGISWMAAIVNQSGCQWWECTAPAQTARMRRESWEESSRLCRTHADEGEARGFWNEGHPNNTRWRQEDAERRAGEARRSAEAEALDAPDSGAPDSGAPDSGAGPL